MADNKSGEKSCLAFYVSSHGFGHLTRCLAIIEEILVTTSYDIYICSGTKQIGFAKIYLDQFESRVNYSVRITDIGLINKENSLDVDIKKTNNELRKLLKSYQLSLKQELENIDDLDIKLIVSDITPLAFLVGEALNLQVVGIANFTWIDQYINLGIATEIMEQFKKMYHYGEKFFKYDISLAFAGVSADKLVDTRALVARPIINEKVEAIKKEYRLRFANEVDEGHQPDILFISLGKSAELLPIVISNFSGIVFYTEGVQINFSHHAHRQILFCKLPIDIKDTQSYIAASDITIAKAGWSSVSESLIAHTKLLLIEREGVDDDMNTIKTLKERRLATSIKVDDLVCLDYGIQKEKAKQDINISKLELIRNNVKEIKDILLGCIN